MLLVRLLIRICAIEIAKILVFAEKKQSKLCFSLVSSYLCIVFEIYEGKTGV